MDLSKNYITQIVEAVNSVTEHCGPVLLFGENIELDINSSPDITLLIIIGALISVFFVVFGKSLLSLFYAQKYNQYLYLS